MGRQLHKLDDYIKKLGQFMEGSYFKLFLGKDLVIDINDCNEKLLKTKEALVNFQKVAILPK